MILRFIDKLGGAIAPLFFCISSYQAASQLHL
jgi:hypothetical protein